MQQIQPVWRGMSSLAWLRKLCGCACTPGAQATKDQAVNSSHRSTHCCSIHKPHPIPGAEAGAFSTNNVQSTTHLKDLSTKSPPINTESNRLVDAQLTTSIEGIHCFNSTSTKSTVSQWRPSTNKLLRAFSTTCIQQREDSPLNESTKEAADYPPNQQSTDPQHRLNSNVEPTASPLQETAPPSGGQGARSSTPQPPDPETCCESGCVNCVWIRYVQELQQRHPAPSKEELRRVLDLIEDYNVKMFVKMEMGL